MARTPKKPKGPDKLRDVDIETAPLLRSDGTPIEQHITARGLLLEMQDCWKVHADRRYPQSMLNERFIAGEQQYAVSTQKGVSELIVDWPQWRGRFVARNLMRNLHLTNVARVTKGDPSVSAWAGDGTSGDLAASAVGNALIYSLRTSQDHRKRISRAAWTTGAQGTVAFYTTWATDKGPLVDNQYLGDVDVAQPIQVFDWMTSGEEDIEGCTACAVRRWLTCEDAERRLLSKGIEEPPEKQAVKTIWGDGGDERVECWEYWHKPTARLPNGLFIMFVGGHVVDVRDFPYDHGELPLSIWKWVDVPDSPLGATPADDAVPIQRVLNDRHSDLSIITQKSARWLMVLTSKEIAKQIKADPTVIGIDDIAAIGATKIISAPPPPALIYTQIEEAERMLREVYGVNEAVSGSDTSQMKNARMMAYTTELDGQKLASTIVARDHALLRVYRQALGLWRQFVEESRTVKIMGANNTMQVVAFSGADLNGVDVYLEPTSGQDQTRKAQALDAEQASVAGFMDPAKGAELRQTGQSVTRVEAMQRTIVQRQIADAMQGFAAEPDPNVGPDIAMAEIALALEQANEMARPALEQLLAAYQAIAQQMAQPEPPQGQPEAIAQPEQGIA